MIIHQLKIDNFGAYSGRQVFNLAPIESGLYARPIVIIRGKNGVGKSTVLEAVRLCLHGALTLGRGVSRNAYEEYLASRIHRPTSKDRSSDSASLNLSFDHVVMGKKRRYTVERRWVRKSNGASEQLDVWEDTKELAELNLDQKEALLRELVLPGVAEMFLFDSEKLHLLTNDDAGNLALREMVVSLLGLDLTNRLQRDLDIYLSKQGTGTDRHSEEAYSQTLSLVSTLTRDRDKVLFELQSKETELLQMRAAIRKQEQRIAHDGGAYADKYAKLKAAQEHFTSELARQRLSVQEMTSGLMPFAICPALCKRAAAQLEAESDQQGIQTVDVVSKSIQSRVTDRLQSEGFWDDVPWKPTQLELSDFIARLLNGLSESASKATGDLPFLLHASERDRITMLDWIERAGDQISREFCQAIKSMQRIESALIETDQQLALVPAEEVLEPLVRELHFLNEQAACIQGGVRDLDEHRRRLEYELQQAEWKVQSYRQKTIEQNKGKSRIELTGKAQTVLKAYGDQMLQKKLVAFSEAITLRFSELCRKPGFAERIVIDAETFGLTIYRRGRVFQRSELSAGEKQLLATAVLWALRDISRLPIPVFVDTPVARLDTDHREAMLVTFLPHVSHQTVLLTTDVEMDAEALASLSPIVSRRYELEYMHEIGITKVTESGSTIPSSETTEMEMTP